MRLELTLEEQFTLEKIDMAVGRVLVNLLGDAMRQGGLNPEGLQYRYSRRVFTT